MANHKIKNKQFSYTNKLLTRQMYKRISRLIVYKLYAQRLSQMTPFHERKLLSWSFITIHDIVNSKIKFFQCRICIKPVWILSKNWPDNSMTPKRDTPFSKLSRNTIGLGVIFKRLFTIAKNKFLSDDRYCMFIIVNSPKLESFDLCCNKFAISFRFRPHHN